MDEVKEISKELISELFDIDEEKGLFYWKKISKHHSEKKGRLAGCSTSNGNGKSYWCIKINGKRYKRSRLMFLYKNGRLPYPTVDHINGDSLDDSPQNLREATLFENAWNHKGRSKKSNLPMGIREQENGKFTARISFMKKQINLGTYSTVCEAEYAYISKRKELFGEFA